MRNTIFIALTAMLAIPATASAQDCQPAFVDGSHAFIVNGISIEPGTYATEDFEVRVRNEAGASPMGAPTGMPEGGSSGPCKATIRVARVGALSGPDFPAYSLSAPGNREIEILPDPASSGTRDGDVIVANAPSGPQGRSVPFQFSMPTEWGLRAGTYTDQLQLLLIDESGSIADRSSLTATIIVPSASSLRLVGPVVGSGSRGPAQIDLGPLSSSTETRSKPFAARIFSTAPYAVEFSSVNMGNLLHEQGREEIPYRLYFDGVQVDLAGTYEIAYPEHSPRGGDKRDMSIVVPPVVALAGNYSDRITMTVTAM